MTTRQIIMFCLTMFLSMAIAQAEGGHGGSGEKGFEAPDGQVMPLDIIRRPDRIPYLVSETPAGRSTLKEINSGIYQNLSHFPMVRVIYPSTLPPTSGHVTSFSDQMKTTLLSLRFYLVTGPLEDSKDVQHTVLSLKIDGQLVQIALQDSLGNVALDKEKFLGLNDEYKEIVFEHETLIALYRSDTTHLPKYTDAIMDLVNYMNVKDSRIPLTSAGISQLACAAGLPVVEGTFKQTVRIDDAADPKRHFNSHRYMILNFAEENTGAARCRLEFFTPASHPYTRVSLLDETPDSLVEFYKIDGQWQSGKSGRWVLSLNKEDGGFYPQNTFFPQIWFIQNSYASQVSWGEYDLAQSPYRPEFDRPGKTAIFEELSDREIK